MTPALGTLPELLRRPGLTRRWIPELHLCPTPLAADLDLGLRHPRDSSTLTVH